MSELENEVVKKEGHVVNKRDVKWIFLIVGTLIIAGVFMFVMRERAVVAPVVSEQEIQDSIKLSEEINQRYKAAASEMKQDLVGDNLLWSERTVSEDSEYILELPKDERFYEAGLTDEDIRSMSQSLSYYCDVNSIPHESVEVTGFSINEDNLCLTQVDLGTVKLEQVYRPEDKMQRVNYIEGDDEMDKLGVRYDGMNVEDKSKFAAMFEQFVGFNDGTEFWSVKELNCCYLLFYIENDEHKLIRVSKDSGEISHRGIWTEDGEYEMMTIFDTAE